MILSCPECTAQFNVAQSALAPNGRTVRCGRCGHAWFVGTDGQAAEPPLPAVVVAPKERASRGPRGAGAAEDRIPDLAALRRAAAASAGAEPGRLRRAGGWALLIALLAAVGAALWWRDDVITTVPVTRPVYEALRLVPSAPGDGLRIYATPQRLVRDGMRFVILEGQVVNVSSTPRPVPELRGTLRDKEERDLQVWRIALPPTVLQPNEKVDFRSEVLDTSPEAIEATVAFVGSAGG